MDLTRLTQNRWASAAFGLVGGQVLGRAFGFFLGSPAGEQVMERLGGDPLTPLERRVLAWKWSGPFGNALSGIVAALLVTRRIEPGGDHVLRTQLDSGTVAEDMAGRKIDWVQIVQRSGEIMLAFGAIFRILGEYLEDRQKVAREDQRAIARRI